MKCLEKYIGLSKSKCNCRPEALRYFRPHSSIGLYLDNERYSVPLNFIGTKADCDSGGIVSILLKARKNGAREFASLIARSVKEKYGYNDLPVSFGIGRKKENGALTIAETYKGIYIESKAEYRSGVITIRKIRVKGNQGEDFDLNLFQEGDRNPTRTKSIINHDGNDIEVNWSLNMTDNGQAINWMILGDYPNVRNHIIKCSTCGTREPYQKYMNVSGITSASIDGSNPVYDKKYSNGLSIDASFHCGHQWLCDNNNDTDGLGRQIGEGAYLCAVIELLSFLENRPTPFTPAPVEYIAMKKNEAFAQLEDRVNWIVENAGNRLAGCSDCSKNKLRKTSILI